MRGSARKYVYSALFAALCCITTLFPQIPAPLGGYVNCGDVFVILSGLLLGPAWGAAAAGLGSCLADVLVGFAVYAPATLIIKALMALLAAALSRCGTVKVYRTVIAAVLCEIIMVLGYFAYEGIFLGYGTAAAVNIPFNCIQGVFGAAASTVLFSAIRKLPFYKSIER